jgi:hypothetical protein
MQTWQVVNYDVWGNDEDGYQVNDLYPGARFTVADGQDVLAAAIEAGELDADWSERLEVDQNVDNETAIYLNIKENGRPAGEFRKVDSAGQAHLF